MPILATSRHCAHVRYAVTSPELAILLSTDHELIGRWAGEREV